MIVDKSAREVEFLILNVYIGVLLVGVGFLRFLAEAIFDDLGRHF